MWRGAGENRLCFPVHRENRELEFRAPSATVFDVSQNASAICDAGPAVERSGSAVAVLCTTLDR
jgi:hypothetical protein